MAYDRLVFPLQRHLAAGHQYSDNHHHVSEGLPNSAYSEHRLTGSGAQVPGLPSDVESRRSAALPHNS
jgi:hypothetical protein